MPPQFDCGMFLIRPLAVTEFAVAEEETPLEELDMWAEREDAAVVWQVCSN
jgi:hypothetical protein